MASKPLTRLAQRDVQKISSGCNITSLCATVKEMLENSIDAGAKIIAIRLTNTGLKKIVVQDNGCGIADEALVLLGRRHYTSKIRDYEDLSTLQTYGFRGEAFNSLCQFADVTVQTRQRDSKEGRVVTFDRAGAIRTWSTSPYCPVGTFSTVENLFQNVPVRYQEACKPGRQKQQYLGLVHMCLAYSIIHPELKISLYNDESCSRDVQKSSRCTDLAGSINGVLGAVAQSLVHLQGADEAHGVQMDLFAPDPNADYTTVSRSSTDRVFLSCNRRPFDSKKVLKAIRNALGNVLPEGSRNRYPVVVLAIEVPPEQLDVNCTPDKRTVCFTEEEVVLNCLNRLLLSLYVPNGANAGPSPTPSPTPRHSGEDMCKDIAKEVGPVDPGPSSTHTGLSTPALAPTTEGAELPSDAANTSAPDPALSPIPPAEPNHRPDPPPGLTLGPASDRDPPADPSEGAGRATGVAGGLGAVSVASPQAQGDMDMEIDKDIGGGLEAERTAPVASRPPESYTSRRRYDTRASSPRIRSHS